MRWENNIRMASVLGFVGAGGLGQMLYVSLSLFQEAQASTVILAMLVLVFAGGCAEWLDAAALGAVPFQPLLHLWERGWGRGLALCPLLALSP